MRTSIKLLLIVVILLLVTNNGYCYRDKEFNYSIDFPKGWEIDNGDVYGVNGVRAIHKSGAILMVGAKRQYTDHIVFTDEFARYYAYNGPYKLIKATCPEAILYEATAAEFDGHNALLNTIICEKEVFGSINIIYNGVTYTIMTLNKVSNKNVNKTIIKSLKTFKIAK